ncbi:MAG: AAA family ATPase, partial [Aphanizomenon sp.]
MVYVKRVELTNFKSFGGTTAVPLLPGCTVISGPNGSGKSNILDALLFCLGLASSKGMRAERLPDLVNNAQKHQGRSALEASVTVTFDISDVSRRDAKTRKEEEEEEKPKSSDWSVTRRLRVSQQGGYTSNYYINGVACTLTELHEDLEELRIYPEGYNVVLQGDVTSIISMNARERREIIDELAGVATYDRKIVQAKSTLDEVKDKEDSCRIIQTELSIQCDRLSQDKVRAEKYQLLRVEFIEKQSWSAVLSWRSLQLQQEKLVAQVQEGDRNLSNFTTELTDTNAQINRKTTELDQLNLRVKALGEEELLAVQSNLATQEAERKQLQRQQRELETSVQESTRRLNQT